MLKFCSLYSGSTGNCLFVQSDSTHILVDAGVSIKKITQALDSLDVSIECIDGILVTHEHSDHVKSIGALSKKYNIPVYANYETWNHMLEQKEKVSIENQKNFINDSDFLIGDLTIHPFSTPHDASNPCGFNISNSESKLSIATDLGHMNNHIFDNLKSSSFVLLESNYDPEVLKCSHYPYHLKTRIAGPTGHLSNSTAGKTIASLMNYNLKNVMLGHLSKENNFPELAHQTILEEIHAANLMEKNINLNIASRDEPSNLITV